MFYLYTYSITELIQVELYLAISYGYMV